MKASPSPLIVPFTEVRHFRPQDCLHYEPIDVRGRLHHWTIPAHRHDGLHQFQLLSRGSLVAILDGERHALRAPAALMVAPGVVHGFVYDPESAGQQVTVPSGLLGAIAAHAKLGEQLRHTILLENRSREDLKSCEALYAELEQEFRGSQPGRTEALQALVQLIGLWFLRRDSGEGSRRQPRQLRDALVQRYRGLIEQHFRQHHQVHHYSRLLSVTADHLSRVCRGATGRGALDLLHERLILEARRMLAYTPATIAEVAAELGFDDPAYFSRFFSRSLGASPSGYRGLLATGQALPAALP